MSYLTNETQEFQVPTMSTSGSNLDGLEVEILIAFEGMKLWRNAAVYGFGVDACS